jgi:hypothetical protein
MGRCGIKPIHGSIKRNRNAPPFMPLGTITTLGGRDRSKPGGTYLRSGGRMTLQEWLYKEFGDDPSDGVMYSIPMYSKIWTAAQKAEREKYAELITAAEAVVEKLCELIERWKDEN